MLKLDNIKHTSASTVQKEGKGEFESLQLRSRRGLAFGLFTIWVRD
jgi:hypothetical protein